MVAEKIIVDKSESEHNHLTMSTKLSTDQLICKSPNTSSPEGSLKSLRNAALPVKEDKKKNETPITLYFGILQISFGLLMAVFGVLVLVHDASLAQLGGGLWGGCVATLTGVLGVLSAAKECCPLKTNAQRIALTAFLALSLVSLAVSNLVLVLASIGLARDASKSEDYMEMNNQNEQTVEDDLVLPANYSALLTSAGLLIISGCECVAAAFSAYHCAKALCPCFRGPTDKDCAECGSTLYAPSSGKDMLVSSWLGKQQPPTPPTGLQPVYVVTTNHRKRTAPVTVAPVFSLPASPPSVLTPTLVRLPLIPAPLGTTPPPLVNAHLHQHSHHVPQRQVPKKRTRYPSDRQLQEQQRVVRQEKPKRQKKKQAPVTTEDVAKTYTGLDRVIAEEFIEICDLTKSGSDTTGCTNSDITSD